MKQRKSDKVTDKDKTVFNEPPPSRQSECGCYVSNSTEHDSPRRVKQKLTGDGLSDALLLFRIINMQTKHEYKIYATGEIEGFPPDCFVINYFPTQAIKFMLAQKKTT